MDADIEAPEWVVRGTITVRYTELNPVAVEALIETLRDVLDQDDDRVRGLLRLWDALTADD